jgi:hypothetical protein
MSKERLNPGETIVGLSIADEDAADWVRTLVEGGFSNAEIDMIMSGLNKTYKSKMTAAEIEKEFIKIKEDLKQRKGYELNEDEAERIKQGIASRFS